MGGGSYTNSGGIIFRHRALKEEGPSMQGPEIVVELQDTSHENAVGHLR